MKRAKIADFEWLPFWRLLEMKSEMVGMVVFDIEMGWCRFVRVIPHTLTVELCELENLQIQVKPLRQIFVRIENFESKINKQ